MLINSNDYYDDEDEEEVDDSPDFSELKWGQPITPLKMRKEWSDPKVQQHGPRPQGYEKRDEHLKIVWHKTGKWDSVIKHKVEQLSYSDFQDITRNFVLKNKDLPFASLIVTNASVKMTGFYDKVSAEERRCIFYNSGWDSSFHDASWTGTSFILAFGKNETEAEHRRDKAFHSLTPDEDPEVKKFKLRKLVRHGD